jgi:hypothetical protein
LQSLRGVTLPNEEVMELLRTKFLVGTRNIERDSHVGLSHGYACNQTAVGTTNGAGGRNVQMLVLSADETVVHALPGFWHAEDLLVELQLALEVHRLHVAEDLSPASKLAMFKVLHRSHLRRHGEGMASRSEWQGFDRAHEAQRAQTEARDTFIVARDGTKTLKSIPQLVHDRMVARPFQRLSEFGLASFVDYGRPFYDNNEGLDRGRAFPQAVKANQKREQELEKERERAALEAAKAEKAAKAAKPTKPTKPAKAATLADAVARKNG